MVVCRSVYYLYSWWFQPIWKNMLIKMGSSSPSRVKNETCLKPPASNSWGMCVFFPQKNKGVGICLLYVPQKHVKRRCFSRVLNCSPKRVQFLLRNVKRWWWKLQQHVTKKVHVGQFGNNWSSYPVILRIRTGSLYSSSFRIGKYDSSLATLIAPPNRVARF